MSRLALALILMVLFVTACDSRYSEEAKFDEIQKKLMAVPDLTKIPASTQITNEPYLNGKIAVFQSLQKGDIPLTYFMQPSYYREMQDKYATTPEEVGTVALIDCKVLQKGVYKTEDGKEYPAMVEDCNLTLIDRSKQAVIFKKAFEKTPAQDRSTRGDFVVTQTSQDEILAFLKGLPKK